MSSVPKTEHHMTGPRMRLHERIHVLRAKDVAVVGHREGCTRERLAIRLPARFALVAILLHTRMHDEFRERQAAIQLEDALVLGIVLQAQARVGHREGCTRERLAIRLPARFALVAILLHTRMHDEFRERQAAIQLEDALVLGIVLQTQARFDRDGQRRAVAHISQKHLELAEVAQKAGALALGNHRARRAAQVEVDLAIPQLGQLACGPHELVGVLGEQLRDDVQPLVVGGVDLCGPHELVGVLGEQLRDDVQPLVVGGVDLLECLAAKRITHARRGEKRGVVAVESAKTLSMHATERVPRDPLHGGERVDHLAILPRCALPPNELPARGGARNGV